MLNQTTIQRLLEAYPNLSRKWDDEIIPTLQQFIKIPNQSPLFDPEWESHGYMDQAVNLIKNWCQQQSIKNMQIKLLQDPGYTPLLLIHVPGENDAHHPVLMYGHLDKQPPMRGWDAGLGAWDPVLKDGKLYGRGAADDGYSVFSALSAIGLLQQLNIAHAPCIILVEASEESGSIHLPHYLQQLYAEFSAPSLVVGLDSGCFNYEQLWATTSLRGSINGILKIKTLNQGIHSGAGGGVVPSVFSILRTLLDRVEESASGKITLAELNRPVPSQQLQHARMLAQICNLDELKQAYPLAGKTKLLTTDIVELILNQSWHPALAITGIEGLPDTTRAGNVIIPNLAVKLSVRLSPDADGQECAETLKKVLEDNPPYQAEVSFTPEEVNRGWLAPPLADWLKAANEQASQLFFNKPAMYLGEGGTIPFMGMLGEKFPKAQFLITGVLGPHSNAHGPNEFLHIEMAKKLTACIATVLAAHFQHAHD